MVNINYIIQIKEILKKEQIPQTELAQKLGVTFAALNRWIHGHARPHPSKIKAIEKYYREKIGYPAITAQALKKLEKEASKMRVKGLWSIIAREESLQKELLLEHTYNSTTIEGTTFTRNQTRVVLFDRATFDDKTLVEHLDVTNHAAVLRDILQKKIAGPISEKLIRQMHLRLLQGIRPDAGEYSALERRIHGSDIALTHPKDIAEEMSRLIRSWRRAGSPITVGGMADFHASFEMIHPFGDGNGRLGRLLLTLQCLQADLPPIVIENSKKAEYYDVLEYAQRTSSAPFVSFLVEEMKVTRRMIAKFI